MADVVIVGAGPAGLAAARTLARLGFQAVVIERLPEAGALTHFFDALVVPASGPAITEPAPGGLYFPQVDLVVPESLILSQQASQRCLAPNGTHFSTIFDAEQGPAILLDRSALLRMLARQAAAAGASFQWGTAASGLIFEGEQVVGVRTTAGDVRARLVLSAEGAARHLCEQADLYALGARSGLHLVVAGQELAAPLVGPAQLGRIVTLGRSHPAAPDGYGTLIMPAPGRAIMLYTMLLDDVSCGTVATAWRYLAEYATDSRIKGLLEGAHVVRRSSFLIPVGRSPQSVVRDGFMGIGDAIAPAGYLGILPALYLGRQAALIAAGALEDDDVSAAALAPFDDFFRTTLLPGLEAEAQAMTALLSMDNRELDRLSAVLNALHLPVPFLQSSAQPAVETLSWLARHLALNARDLSLVARVFGLAEVPSYEMPGYVLQLPVAS